MRERHAIARSTEAPDEPKEIASQLRDELQEQIARLRDMVNMYRSGAG